MSKDKVAKLRDRSGQTFYPKGMFMTLNSLAKCLQSFNTDELLVASEGDDYFRIEKLEVTDKGKPILILRKME